MLPKSTAHRMVSPIPRVGFPASVKLFEKHPHRHAQRCVSQRIHYPVRLSMMRVAHRFDQDEDTVRP